jgi:hypothetical protein
MIVQKPMERIKLTVPEAAKKAKKSTETIRTWIEDFKIGKKIAGRYEVYSDMLQKVLNGELTYENQGRPSKKDKKKDC